MWMWAAVAGPLRPLKVSFQVSVLDLPFSTTVPVNEPVPLDLVGGVSCEPTSLVLTLYVSSDDASPSPAKDRAAAATASSSHDVFMTDLLVVVYPGTSYGGRYRFSRAVGRR